MTQNNDFLKEILVVLIPVVGTWFVSRYTTKMEFSKNEKDHDVELEKFYSEKVMGLLGQIEKENEKLKKAIEALEFKVKQLESDVSVKDELIEELRKDNKRLEEENAALKGYNKEKEARIKELLNQIGGNG